MSWLGLKKAATATETGLILGLIAVTLIFTLSSVGGNLNKLFGGVNTVLATGNVVPAEENLPAPNPDLHIVSVVGVGNTYYYDFSGRDTIQLAVTFSEPVTITGTPSLPLQIDTGSGVQAASIISGSGTNYVAEYTIASDDRDYDGLAVGSTLVLNGAVISDQDGNYLTDVTIPTLTSDDSLQIHFNPETISSLAAWWDADDGSTLDSTSSVSEWSSKVGSYKVTQYTTPNQPTLQQGAINGRDVLNFVSANSQYLQTSTGVLSGGDATYTYAAVWTAGKNASMVVFEQNSASSVANTRSALLVTSTGYGFNGQSNDYHSSVPYGLNATMRTIMRVNGAGGSNAIRILSNGAAYASDTGAGASNLNVGTANFAVGFKTTANNEYLQGKVAEILIFRDNLSDADVASLNQYLNDKW